MMKRHGPALAIAAAAIILAAAPAAAQERYSVDGDHVAIFNIAGEVRLEPTSGRSVAVELRRGGRDAGGLGVEVGPVDGRQTLRVIYPSRRVVYPDLRHGGRTNLRVRSDGTWGTSGWPGGGDRVEVAGSGSGMEAWADMRVMVPRGQRIELYIAAGRVLAENLDGRIRLDTHTGPVEARGMSGSLLIDTGSGSVRLEGMAGDLEINTGSGSVRVSDVDASAVGIDTGSGRVQAANVRAGRIDIDTGSGGIELRRSAAPDVRLDTGSGGVVAELSGVVDRLEIDTGSGGVTLHLPEDLSARLEVETGSGGIDVDFPLAVTRRSRGELVGQIGDGRGTIVIDTGSGGVRIRRL